MCKTKERKDISVVKQLYNIYVVCKTVSVTEKEKNKLIKNTNDN